MLATRLQNTSGWSVSRSGPGCTPWMVSAESSSAVAGIDGMPSASSGIMAVPVTALLAVSGPATPAMAPWPNSSGWRENRFSTA